jgi:NADH-quinone oxidoreductase subunit B
MRPGEGQRDEGQQDEGQGAAPEQTCVLIVAGTVTDKLAPLVLRAYERMPGRKRVISFGACSNSGGPYWDSYCVTKGVDQFIPVDLYVPGCPPRPEALRRGLDILEARRLAEEQR